MKAKYIRCVGTSSSQSLLLPWIIERYTAGGWLHLDQGHMRCTALNRNAAAAAAAHTACYWQFDNFEHIPISDNVRQCMHGNCALLLQVAQAASFLCLW